VRIQTISALSEQFRALGIPQEKYNEFALLNNMDLTTRIEAGTMIKIAR
jgi:hypothetical protein